MIRGILIIVLPILIAILFYSIWRERQARIQGKPLGKIKPSTVQIATLIAIFALVAGCGALLINGAEPGSTYTPPRLEDGKIIPSETR